MHPVIQSAVAAQHVKDMLDRAAEDNRARRPAVPVRAAAGGGTPRGSHVRPTPPPPPAATSGAAHRGAAATQCCPD